MLLPSIGDLVTVGSLAYKLSIDCVNAPTDCKELGDLCRDIQIVINNCRPNDPRTVLCNQDDQAIEYLAKGLQGTLGRLELLLAKYGTMGGLQGVGNRIGFVGSKGDRESIRRRLSEHLVVMNTVLSGTSIGSIDMLAQHLKPLLEESQDPARNRTMNTIAQDPSWIDDILTDFSQGANVPYADLVKLKGSISKRLQEGTVKRSDSKKNTSDKDNKDDKDEAAPAGTRQTGDDTCSDSLDANEESSKEATEVKMMPVLPAKVSTAEYNPWQLDWFAGGGFRFFNYAEGVGTLQFKLNPSIMRYSKEDERLSHFPIGWSASETLVHRDGTPWKAVFYIYNKLSCSPTTRPDTSRAYCEMFPFVSEDDTVVIRNPNQQVYDWHLARDAKVGPPGRLRVFHVQPNTFVRQGYPG